MSRNGLAALLLTLLLSSSAIAQDWAEKMFETTRHDFGSVARGAKTQYAFVIKNIYAEDVHIASVRSSCRCTQASITKPWLKSTEEGALVAEINTPLFRGHKPATITVTFDQPRYAQVQLQSEVTIRGDVVLEPGVVELGAVDQGSAAQKEITVSHSGRSDWRIVEVTSANPHLSAEAVETRRDRSEVAYTLSVRLDESTPAGYLRDQLSLVTSDGPSQPVPVPVEGLVQAPIVVSPASLFMGVVQPGQTVTKQLVVRGKKPFRITSVRCDDDCFRFNPTDQQECKSLHLVPVTFVAGQSSGKVFDKIRIETDLAQTLPELSAYAVISP